MDSPRIPKDVNRGVIYQYCYRLEQSIYNSIKPANIILHLQVPLEIAVERNNLREKFGKETEKELQQRFESNSNALFLGEIYKFIDADSSMESVFTEASHDVWVKGVCRKYEQ